MTFAFAFASEPTFAFESTFISEPAFVSIESAFQSFRLFLSQQFYRQSIVSISVFFTNILAFEMFSSAPIFAPRSAFQQSSFITSQLFTSAFQIKIQQPSLPTPQRITYTAAILTLIFQTAAMVTSSKISQVTVLDCTFYKKGMG